MKEADSNYYESFVILEPLFVDFRRLVLVQSLKWQTEYFLFLWVAEFVV